MSLADAAYSFKWLGDVPRKCIWVQCPWWIQSPGLAKLLVECLQLELMWLGICSYSVMCFYFFLDKSFYQAERKKSTWFSAFFLLSVVQNNIKKKILYRNTLKISEACSYYSIYTGYSWSYSSHCWCSRNNAVVPSAARGKAWRNRKY